MPEKSVSELGDEPHEGRPPLDSTETREAARRVIQSDRITRLQILNYLWRLKRTGEHGGYASDVDVREALGNDDEAEVRFHLDTLADHGLIDIGTKTRGGYAFIKIRGSGTTTIEDFFLQIDEAFRSSNDEELKNQIKEIDKVEDVYIKHEKYITTMSTIQSGFEFGNSILRALGLG